VEKLTKRRFGRCRECSFR